MTKFLSLSICTLVLLLIGCSEDTPNGGEKYTTYCDAEYLSGGKYALDCTLNGTPLTANDASVTFDASTDIVDDNGNPVYTSTELTLKNIVPNQKSVVIKEVPIEKINGGYSFRFSTTSGGTAISGYGTVQASYSSGNMIIAITSK